MGGALETGRELRERRDETELPGRLGLRLGLRLVESCVAPPRGITGEGDSPSSPHFLPSPPPRVHTPSAVRSEDRQSGVKRRPMEDWKWGVPMCTARSPPPQSCPCGAHMRPLAYILLENKNENSKIEEEEAKSTPFQPSPEMS